MKKTTIMMTGLILFALIFSLAPLASGQKHYKELQYGKLNDVTIPQPKQVTLKNGIRLFLLEDHELPFIKMQARFVAGSAWEPADKAGLAGITGMVMRTGGSQTMAGDQVDEKLEKIAASVETGIGTLDGSAGLSTLKEHFDKVLAIYNDILRNPAFPSEKIELAKIEYKSAISRRNDDVGGIAQREYTQLIYGADSPYARDEEYATIDAITREDLIAFHKKYVQPKGMVLAVWGDFKTAEMLGKLRKTFESWRGAAGPLPKAPPVEYAFRNTVNLVPRSDVNQSNIYLGHIGGLMNTPDEAALVMMNEILSGGFASRLMNRLRATEGLAYHVSGAYGANALYPGIFYMMLQTQSGRTVEAIHSMVREMRLMATEPISEAELNIARESWLNAYVFNFDSKDEVVRRMASYAFTGLPLDYLQKLRAQIEQVTVADVQRAAQKYLRPDQVQILVVGNPAEFGEPLSKIGPVNEIDITIPVPGAEAVPEASAEAKDQGHAAIQQMLSAMGGADKLAAVQTIEYTAKLIQTTPMGEMSLDAKTTIAFPDKSCSVLVMPQGQIKMILNGDKALLVAPQGSMPAPEPIKQNMIENLFRDPLMLARQVDEVQAQWVGETLYQDKPVREVIVSKGALNYHLFIDKATSLPLAIKYTTISQQGPTEVEERYEDYRDVNGIKVAWRTLGFDKGSKASESAIVSVVMDGPVDPTMFEK
ncbi:MAG: Peptidase M16 inactive domain protein [bacterium ADurb.Bin478]|nr:MAG: Peptidase M16 inactive domain protein [bacterium ADurb.Bin478]